MKTDNSFLALIKAALASKKAKWIIPLAVLSLFSLLYISQTVSNPPKNAPSPLSSEPTPTSYLPQNVTFSSKKYYLQSTTVSSKEVSSLYWYSASPFYTAGNSVYSFNVPTPIFTHSQKVSHIYLPHTKGISFSTPTEIDVYNPLNNQLSTYSNIKGRFYSPSFGQYAQVAGKNIDIFSNNKIVKSLPSPETITNILWSPNETYVLGLSSQKNFVVYLSFNEDRGVLTKLANPATQIEISPDGKYFAAVFSNSLVIYQSDDTSKFTVYKYGPETKSALAVWSPYNHLFLIEKQNTRYENDLIYQLSPESLSKNYLLDSFATSSSIDFTKLPVSSYNEDLLFSDLKGSLWIITTKAPFQNAQEFFTPENNHDGP